MFSNEFSFPYQTKVDRITVTSIAHLIGALKDEIKVPFGVDCQYDAEASIDLALTTGAKFLREVISGAYAGDFGFWNTNPSDLVRYRARMGAKDIKMLFSINPTNAVSQVVQRDLTTIAKTAEFNLHPDGLVIAGLATDENDAKQLNEIRSAVTHTPIVCDAGCNKDNIVRRLQACDAAICATTFKKEGIFENPVDINRVKEFMDVVHKYRETL